MPRLSVSDCHELINLHLSGLSNRKIDRRLKCNEKMIRMTVKKQQNTGSVLDAPKSGHPRVTSYRENNAIKICSLRNRFEMTFQIQQQCNLVKKCSLSTVKPASCVNGSIFLHEDGIIIQIPASQHINVLGRINLTLQANYSPWTIGTNNAPHHN